MSPHRADNERSWLHQERTCLGCLARAQVPPKRDANLGQSRNRGRFDVLGKRETQHSLSNKYAYGVPSRARFGALGLAKRSNIIGRIDSSQRAADR